MESKKDIKEYRRQYYIKNKDTIIRQNKESRSRNPEAARQRVRKYAKTNKGRYATYKGGAKVRGLVFELSLDEFETLINKNCYYCGDKGYGIDRLDSNIGYIQENITPCCTKCNLMKQSSTEVEFIKQCQKIVDKWKCVN